MSGTALKLVALVLMLIDHIGMLIPGMPVWTRWLGRISAPIFLFMLIVGMEKTSDRPKYLGRLYIGSAVMGVIDLLACVIVREPYALLENNIFTTLFLVGILIHTIEKCREEPDFGKRMAVILVIVQAVSIIMCAATEALFDTIHLEYLICALLPNVIYTEGSFLMVILGLLFYWYRKEPKWLSVTFLLTCAAYAVLVFFNEGGSLHAVLYDDYQWMMCAAVPFMLAYNGKRGLGIKYFFYGFYPVHLVVLYIIGNVIAK